jgi:hypothetical protein
MNFVELVFFVLSTIGMSHIIVDGSILQWFRDFVKSTSEKIKMPKLGGIVDCYLCCGTWCGFLMGWVWVTNDPFQIFACGCAGGFISNFAAIILNYLEAATVMNMPSEQETHES